jgi:cullin 1
MPAAGFSGMPLQPVKDDIDTTWTYLQDGITMIMMNLQQGIDLQTYMGIYTLV